MYCKDCEFFSEIKYGYGECSNPNFIYLAVGSKPEGDDKLLYWDSECYSAYFRVGRHWLYTF